MKKKLLLSVSFILTSVSYAQVQVKAPTPQISTEHVAIGPYFYDANAKGVDIKGELYVSHVPIPYNPSIFYS